MRRFWFVNPETGDKWDLTCNRISEELDGNFLGSVSGLGYKSTITQKQVNVDYFITEKTSKNQDIKGTMIFANDKHIKKFMDFVGSLDNQLEFHCSPDGKYLCSDIVSKTWYKKVVISEFTKGEKNDYGVYSCAVVMTTQSDVWNRRTIVSSGSSSATDNQLVYPYFYTYTYGDKEDALAIDIENKNREIGCKISILNNGSTIVSNPQWQNERTIVNIYGEETQVEQFAKFNISLSSGYELVVDSNNTTQMAYVNLGSDLKQNVVMAQEPSWEYINFIRLETGANRIIFNNVDGCTVTLEYTEQTEIPY